MEIKNQDHRSKGKAYEQAAAVYLARQGLVLECQNFHCRFGEIDLIVRDQDVLVFCEVKYRSKGPTGCSLSAVTPEKQRRIKTTARFYLREHQIPSSVPCRFDVIGIEGRKIYWIRNAFKC